MEGVDHHGELFGFLGSDAFLHCSGMRTVGNAGRMQRDHSSRDILAAHEVAIDVVEYFIAVDIAVIVWRGNSIGMVVVKPGAERTHDEVVRFEGLVHGRWLVYASGNRFEIVNGESEGIAISIPSHYIERMSAVVKSVKNSFLLRTNEEVALLIKCGKILRGPDVALAIR